MNFEMKRRLTFVVVGIYLFLGGCEYGVIFPTAWDYLQSLGATHEYWLGFTLSGYSFTAAIGGVIGGRLADLYVSKTKMIIFISIIIMSIGNIQYCIGYSVTNIFISRLVCGFGTSAGAAMLAEVCRATAFNERTPVLAICNATRQLGILIGPAFQILFTKFHFKIGDFIEFTPLNAPGLMMFVLWLIFSVLVQFLFFNLTDEFNLMESKGREEHLKESSNIRVAVLDITQENHNDYGSINTETNPNHSHHSHSVLNTTSSSRRQSVSERFFHNLIEASHRQDQAGELNLINASSGIPFVNTNSRSRLFHEFYQEGFIVLLGMVFSLFFCQVGIETIIPVIMQGYFGYGEFENSLIYMIGGISALILFFAVAFISRHVRDTTLTIIGWILFLIAQLWLLYFIPTFEEGNRSQLIYFIIGIVLLYIGYPIASVANTGLFSKSLSDETQGFGQGLRRMSSYLGLIFGPLWSGSTIRRPYLFLSVPCVLLILQLGMFALSFKAMREIESKSVIIIGERGSERRNSARYHNLSNVSSNSGSFDGTRSRSRSQSPLMN